jgi:fructose-1,6-bisphosphatase I
VLYGPSTVFVLSTGQGAHGFTLDPSIGEFFLSHPDIRCPTRGSCFSVNEGNFSRWSPEVQAWARWIKGESTSQLTGEVEPFKTPYGARYVGSLVADAHRTLMKGGVFAYPADAKSKNGKLRLLYEANPMAFLFEQAGGMALDGKDRILDIMPAELHQRVPLVLGSKDDVTAFRQFMVGERT